MTDGHTDGRWQPHMALRKGRSAITTSLQYENVIERKNSKEA